MHVIATISISLLLLIWIAALLTFRARPEARTGAARDFVYPLAAAAVLLAWLAATAGTGIARFLDGYLHYGLVTAVLLAGVWMLSLALRDASIMDVAYAPAAALPVAVLAWQRGSWSPHEVVLVSLTALWSLRLGAYIAWRNRGHGEDARYAGWRRRFGANWWWWSLFQVFALQGVLVWLWCLPLALAGDASPAAIGWQHTAAIIVFAVGFAFQAGGDWQLSRFKRNRADRSQVLDGGFWSLTRHPNYFGEAVMWWSFWLLSLVHPWGWLSIGCPLYVTWFLWRGSATPMQERYLGRTKPSYADYVRRVPAFFPWGPRG